METFVTIKVSLVLRPIMEPKERILVKSHELFHRYGIRSVSMDDIAAQLGMSKKTLYQYYADKDALVGEVFEHMFTSSKAHCAACQQKGENVIHEVFLSFDMVQGMLSNMNPAVLFDLRKYHPKGFKKFQDFKNNFLYRMLRDNLEKGIEQGVYREEIDVEVLVRYRLHSITLSFDNDVFPSNKTGLLHIETQLMEHFLYGIATVKGQKLISKYKNQRSKKKTDEK